MGGPRGPGRTSIVEVTCDGHARLLAVGVGVGWPPSLQTQMLIVCDQTRSSYLILRMIECISSKLFFLWIGLIFTDQEGI